MATFSPPYALRKRSKNGNAYWQTGQETLKNTAATGPRLSASRKENVPPSLPLKRAGKEKSGALVPSRNAVISFRPPNRRSIHFIKEMHHHIRSYRWASGLA